MKRREFITLIAAAAARSSVARAQQPSIPVIGYLASTPADSSNAIEAAFREGLAGTGYVEGRNVAIEYRRANNQVDRLPELAADLVKRRVSVILASGGTVAARAAKAATSTIPIVFAFGDDPVAMGLVASFNRPGGNVTGVAFLSSELAPKRLGLLKEVVPGARFYAVLANPQAPNTESTVAALREAAGSIGRRIEVFAASDNREIDTAFAGLVERGADALVVGSSSLLASRRVQLATLAAYHHLPAIYYDRRTTEAGGLMSYGANIADAMRQAGAYAGRILKGEKPADLPVIQPTKYEFLINMQTATTLGLTIPPALRALADEVVE